MSEQSDITKLDLNSTRPEFKRTCLVQIEELQNKVAELEKRISVLEKKNVDGWNDK